MVRSWDAHGAGLGIQAWRKRPQGVNAAADAVLGLEHDDLVALPFELVRGHQAGEAGAEDHDALRLTGPGLEPAFGHLPHRGR